MNFIALGKICFIISMVAVVAGIGILAVFGLNLGIEFTGGSLLEVQYESERPQPGHVQEMLVAGGLNVSSVQPIGEKGFVVRMADVSEEQHQKAIGALGSLAEELRFESIGPVIGKELRSKALLLVGLSLLGIVLYVAFAFRKITKPISSWQWSVVTLAALLHDVVLPLGVLAALGHFMGISVTVPVVVALLTVVGYSVNDTVVIFDRVRENLIRKIGFDFADTVNQSLRQTLTRSISTSFTTLLVVTAILLFGGDTLYAFALTLAVGIVAGTWSSLFVAPFLLVRFAKRNSRQG